MNPNRKNLANAFLAEPITAAATTMTYVAGYGSGKPAVPYFDTLTPQGQLSTMGNSEIVEVTALSGDVATIVRARKGTTAKAFPAGTIASNGIYVEDKVGSENIDWATLNRNIFSHSARTTRQEFIVIGDLQIVFGAGQYASGGTTTTFIRPFDGAPTMTTALDDVNDHGARVSSITSTTFIGRQNYTTAPLWINWIAIGKAS